MVKDEFAGQQVGVLTLPQALHILRLEEVLDEESRGALSITSGVIVSSHVRGYSLGASTLNYGAVFCHIVCDF